MDDEKLNSPDVADFLHAAVDTMYGDGQEPEVYSQLSNATPADILDYLESQGYTEEDILNAMNGYYTDETEEEDDSDDDSGSVEISKSEITEDNNGDGDADRIEVDEDGDGETDKIKVEADSPDELASGLAGGTQTPEEEEMLKTVFKNNAKGTDRKFKPETPEEEEMLKVAGEKIPTSILDALRDSSF